MKVGFLVLGLFFSSFISSFGQANDFQVLIGLNMNDCINCYNNGLNKIDQKADGVDVIMVLSQLYQKDSTKIIKKYNLRGITKNIIWSDSLLNMLTDGGSSVIAFSSKYRNEIIRYDLKGLPDYMFDYLNRARKSIDSLFTNYPDVAKGASVLNPFFVHKHNVYFIDKILDEVKGYDLLSGKKIMAFSIPDSILKKTFAYSGIPSAQSEEQSNILQQAHMAPFEIKTIFFNQDTMGIVFTNFYFIVKNNDSVLKKDNVNIIMVVDGKVVATNHFPISFKNAKDQDKEYWLSLKELNQNNGYIQAFMYSMPEIGQPYDYYVLGDFKPSKNGTFALENVNPKKNPQLYKRTLSCVFPTFNQGYFAFPLIDTLYSVSGKLPPIALNIFPANYPFSTPDQRCDNGIFIDGFYVTDDYVWVAYSDNTKNYETVVRHDRHTGKNEISKNAINFHNQIFTRFDPINPDYILFTLPSKNGILYRAKMF